MLVAPRAGRRKARASGPERVVCAPGTFPRCARAQDTINVTRRELGLREVVYVESEAAAV